MVQTGVSDAGSLQKKQQNKKNSKHWQVKYFKQHYVISTRIFRRRKKKYPTTCQKPVRKLSVPPKKHRSPLYRRENHDTPNNRPLKGRALTVTTPSLIMVFRLIIIPTTFFDGFEGIFHGSSMNGGRISLSRSSGRFPGAFSRVYCSLHGNNDLVRWTARGELNLGLIHNTAANLAAWKFPRNCQTYAANNCVWQCVIFSRTCSIVGNMYFAIVDFLGFFLFAAGGGYVPCRDVIIRYWLRINFYGARWWLFDNSAGADFGHFGSAVERERIRGRRKGGI